MKIIGNGVSTFFQSGMLVLKMYGTCLRFGCKQILQNIPGITRRKSSKNVRNDVLGEGTNENTENGFILLLPGKEGRVGFSGVFIKRRRCYGGSNEEAK